MNQPLIERVARLLAAKGPLSTKEIGMHLREPADRVGSCVKHTRSMGRYGIEVVGRGQGDGRGGPPKILRVNKVVLERYLEMRGPYIPTVKVTRKEVYSEPLKPAATKKSKPPTPKEPKVIYGRKFPVYNGPHRTVWQPSSPYYKGANDEHASPAEGSRAVQQPIHPERAQPFVPKAVGKTSASPR